MIASQQSREKITSQNKGRRLVKKTMRSDMSLDNTNPMTIENFTKQQVIETHQPASVKLQNQKFQRLMMNYEQSLNGQLDRLNQNLEFVNKKKKFHKLEM